MNCAQIKEQLVDYLYEELPPKARESFTEHLQGCLLVGKPCSVFQEPDPQHTDGRRRGEERDVMEARHVEGVGVPAAGDAAVEAPVRGRVLLLVDLHLRKRPRGSFQVATLATSADFSTGLATVTVAANVTTYNATGLSRGTT